MEQNKNIFSKLTFTNINFVIQYYKIILLVINIQFNFIMNYLENSEFIES